MKIESSDITRQLRLPREITLFDFYPITVFASVTISPYHVRYGIREEYGNGGGRICWTEDINKLVEYINSWR